eukprot:12754195-Prorocentrum_lima.AAC.1
MGAMTALKRLASVLPSMVSLLTTIGCLNVISWGTYHLFPEKNNLLENLPQVAYGVGGVGTLE